MIVDTEHHMVSGDQLAKGTSKSGKMSEHWWTADGQLKSRLFEAAGSIEKRLEFMDAAGIDVAVLTLTSSELEACKRWNNLCSEVNRDYPKRFVCLATVPPMGGAPAFEELDRAVKGLGLKGVHITTRSAGRLLDSREMWPFYEKVAKLGVPIDMHVTLMPDGFDVLKGPNALHYVMAREFDMCAATLRLCMGGALEDFPDLVFIMNHFGGGVSSMLDRLEAHFDYEGDGWPSLYFGKRAITKPLRHYFDKLYFNMAGRELGVASVRCALANISPKRLMFGTDFPYNYDYYPERVKRYVAEIRGLGLPEEDTDAMLGGNAARLFAIS